MSAPDIALCDQKNEDRTGPCKEAATLAYRWEWGEQGQTCARCALLLQQTATNLGRTVSITALAGVAAPPLTRDERTQLIAAKLSAEAEADEIKTRGAQLYQQNVDLTKQVQTLTVQKREADATIKGLEKSNEQLQSALEDAQAQIGDLTNEVGRLTTLAAFAPDDGTLPGSGATVNG